MLKALSTEKSSAELIKKLLHSKERQEQALELFNELLPHLAAELENSMHDQDARMSYELVADLSTLEIRVTLKLRKLEHQLSVKLNSDNSTFVVGSERTGVICTNAKSACSVVKSNFMQLRTT